MTDSAASLLQYQRSKYLTRNPISRRLMAGFFNSLAHCVRWVESRQSVRTVLEFGCGEGVSTSAIQSLLPGRTVTAFDLHLPSLRIATRLYPDAAYCAADVAHVPVKRASVDLVAMLEVLEHLPDPAPALREAARVSCQWCIFSVPSEPIWRVLNLLRGAHVRSLGNTPGHLNHWSRRAWVELLSHDFDVAQVLTPLPWLMAVCRAK